MRIRDIMKTRVVSISPTTTVAAARERLLQNGIRHLVVLDRHLVAGVLSEHDLDGRSDALPAADVMSRDVTTVGPSDTLRHAAGLLDGQLIGCLPVVDGGELQGIVTKSDLCRALAKGAVHPPATADRATLRARGPRKHRAGV